MPSKYEKLRDFAKSSAAGIQELGKEDLRRIAAGPVSTYWNKLVE
jgi:hypothetical protein